MTDPHDNATAALPTPAAGPSMRMLEVASIEASLTNPRKSFNQVKLGELAESIKASGVHQPVLVRPLPGSRVPDTFGFRKKGQALPAYELVAGERRLRACRLAGVHDIPAMIRELSDDQVLEIQIVENLQRDDLSEMEEAEGYEHLMQHSGMSAEQVGAKIGKSKSYVYARLKLTALCFDARAALREGKIDASKALLIARIPDDKLQLKALATLLETDYDGTPRYSYRSAVQYIQREFMLRLDAARFKITDATLVPAAGSCRECVKRTGHEPDLFADVKSADVCTDPACYRVKEQAHTDLQLKAAHDRGQTIIDGREAKALMPSSWSTRVEGYLRLDDAADSPNDKPLRKLIGKAMVEAGITPTLIADPHHAGELVAVLLPEQVTPLLLAAGHNKAAERIKHAAGADARHAAAAAKQEAEQVYESNWRWNVLEEAWRVLPSADVENWLPVAVVRHVAIGYANALNTDNAKRLCKLLDLGKVAPKDGITQWVASTDRPDLALQLLVMFRDVEYRTWLTDNANVGLFLVAEECNVDIEAVKAQTQANQRVKTKESADKLAAKTTKIDGSAAQAQVGVGEGADAPKTTRAGKKTARPAAQAPLRKTSAVETMQGIAAAMQGLEEEESPGAAAAAQGNEEVLPVAVAQAEAQPAFELGQVVRVKPGFKGVNGKKHKASGCVGVIEGLAGNQLSVRYGGGRMEHLFARNSDLDAYRADPVVGCKVRVINASGTAVRRQLSWRLGIVQACTNDGWQVLLTGRNGAMAVTEMFETDELEVIE